MRHSPAYSILCSLTAALAATAIGCGAEQTASDARPLVPYIDLDPDPNVVEVQIVAAEGRTSYLRDRPADIWGYRDGADPTAEVSVPGPLLVAKAGDLIIAHVRNDLPVPTTIHWHGVRLPAQQDGSTSVQTPIAPGATHEYRFTASDPGSYWYHPHVKADEQIEKGLYGAIIIEGGSAVDVAHDRYLMLDDVKLASNGQLSTDTDALDLMLGRQGNVLLVNGQSGASLTVASGTRERWRFVNVANGRYFNLSLPGHRFLVIGWDDGQIAEPYEVDTLLIAPGERYEVLVTFAKEEDASISLRTGFYDRGHEIPDEGEKALLQLRFGPPASTALAPLPSAWGIVATTLIPASATTRRFVLSESEGPGEPIFFINGEFWPQNTPVHVQLGATEVWEIENKAEMDHPFHLHGMFFQVLDRDGKPEDRLGWKDTVNVKRSSTLRFAVRYEAEGMWMFHCHILEHAERGMMGELMVHGPNG